MNAERQQEKVEACERTVAELRRWKEDARKAMERRKEVDQLANKDTY